MSDESLGSIINTMQQNNEYIDYLVSRLHTITSKLELNGKQTYTSNIKRAEQRLCAIESKFSSLIDYFSSSKRDLFPSYSSPASIQYDNWKDFRSESADATLVSFLLREKEKTFQVYALRQGRILTYKGEVPESKGLLKSWISNELNASHRKVIEGVLTLG